MQGSNGESEAIRHPSCQEIQQDPRAGFLGRISSNPFKTLGERSLGRKMEFLQGDCSMYSERAPHGETRSILIDHDGFQMVMPAYWWCKPEAQAHLGRESKHQ